MDGFKGRSDAMAPEPLRVGRAEPGANQPCLVEGVQGRQVQKPQVRSRGHDIECRRDKDAEQGQPARTEVQQLRCAAGLAKVWKHRAEADFQHQRHPADKKRRREQIADTLQKIEREGAGLLRALLLLGLALAKACHHGLRSAGQDGQHDAEVKRLENSRLECQQPCQTLGNAQRQNECADSEAPHQPRGQLVAHLRQDIIHRRVTGLPYQTAPGAPGIQRRSDQEQNGHERHARQKAEKGHGSLPCGWSG